MKPKKYKKDRTYTSGQVFLAVKRDVFEVTPPPRWGVLGSTFQIEQGSNCVSFLLLFLLLPLFLPVPFLLL